MGYYSMSRKKDMYINYGDSYKKRRRNGKSKTGKVIMAIVLTVGLSALACYAVYVQIDDNAIKKEQNELEPTLIPTPQVTVQPTPTVTPTQTVTPTPMIEDEEEIITNEEEDTRIPIEVKGIYVSGNVAGSKRMNDLMELADTTEINAMVIDIKDDHGKITYQMDSKTAKEIGATTKMISNIEELVKSLKEKEIYLIARIVAFKDPYLAEQRQDLAIKNKDGSLYRDSNKEGWVNPYKKEVWDYLIEIASQAAGVGFDEIQFDYIRFSTGGGIEKADFGKEAENKTKEEIITEFTKYAYEKIKPMGVFLSADVYGTIINSKVDAGVVGQNYVEMSKYLDYICPMVYPSHYGKGNYGVEYPDLEPYTIIMKSMVSSKMKLDEIPEGEHRAIVRPWLQDFTATWVKPHMEYGGNEIREQVKGVYDAGYKEWILWNSKNKYSSDGLEPQ